MKIMMILPIPFPLEEIKSREDYAKSICSPQTTLRLVSSEIPPPVPNDLSLLSFAVPGILQWVKEAEQEKYDAVVIDCVADSGVEVAKSIANIPVIGPCESSLHVACLLADRFGWIAPADGGIPFHWRQAKTYGLVDRITSIRAVNIPFEEYRDRKEELKEKLVKLGREMMNEGAQLIFVGCTAIFPAIGISSHREVSERLNVTTIDPIGVALNMAEILVKLKLSQSKLAFPRSFF